MMCPLLFSPLKIENMTIPNRVMMTPMGSNLTNPDGSLSREQKKYYTLRARGGAGLIVVENTNVDYPMGANGATQLRLDHDRYIPQLYELCESVHSYGAAIGIQLNFSGASNRADRIGTQVVSSGNLPSKRGGDLPRPMEVEEIYHVVRKFGEAAKRAQLAGFDAVEIHGGHGYLLNQFLSLTMNNRTDEFGGSLGNRARLVRLVAREVRIHVGPGFPVLLRMSADEFVPGGNTLADTLDWLRYVQEFIDVYDVSAGLNNSLEKQIDAPNYSDGWRSYLSRAVKETYGKPVVSMGNYRSPATAEAALARGDADIIGIGRGLIADPDWCRKARSDRDDEIRTCISCNIGCAGNRIGLSRPIRCTVNPAVTQGDSYKELHVNGPCSVVVVGAGTAGLECACTAAEVGCSVTLFEKEQSLGGRVASIGRLPAKKRVLDFTTYLVRRAEKLPNLTIRTGVEATPELLEQARPNIIVCATGSLPLQPPIPGLKEHLNRGRVASIDKMIADAVGGLYPDEMSGKRVVVIGGGAVGLDVVEYFAPRNAEITIVEMLPAIGRDLDPVTKSHAANLLDTYAVRLMPNTALKEVRAEAFLLESAGATTELPFDYGFICLGMKAHNLMLEELEAVLGGSVEIVSVGDSLRARRIMEGVQEGRDIIRTLEVLGYLSREAFKDG